MDKKIEKAATEKVVMVPTKKVKKKDFRKAQSIKLGK